ncbi:MAG TPA: recombinase zinc beta ribbon domain-containing protein, partial [Rubrobacter sp.]|nr:recombinase zinc beta ribbon domain-containing protein [Rubrobacter sp.]
SRETISPAELRLGRRPGPSSRSEQNILASSSPLKTASASPPPASATAAALPDNKRRPTREGHRKYLLSGLARCAVCGGSCTGRTVTSAGKKYNYYGCTLQRNETVSDVVPHRAPYVGAAWLEDLVWQDVRRFVENPGEILDRVREQRENEGADGSEDLAARYERLAARLAAKQQENDRYVRLYAQGHLSEEELATRLADLKNQTDNLRLLLSSVEADLSQKREQAELADTTEAWLRALRERVEDVEGDTPEAFAARRRLVGLLVGSITAGRREEDGRTEVSVTYRFDPPSEAAPDEGQEAAADFVGDVPNSCGNFAAKRNPPGATSRQRWTVEGLGVP